MVRPYELNGRIEVCLSGKTVRKMGRKKVTIHTPRNIDLPAHVVMIPASSDSGSSSVSRSDH